MGDIVEFKKKEEKNNDEFLFSMDVYRTPDGGIRSFLTSINTEDGRTERERAMLQADALDTTAFALEDELWMADEPDSRGAVIATIKIYENSTVRVRGHMSLRGNKRKAWTLRRIREAKKLLIDIMSSPPNVAGFVEGSDPGVDDLQ